MNHALTVALMLTAGVVAVADEDLTVLQERPDAVPPSKQLEVYLTQQFYKHLDSRRDAYERLQSQADCREWQRRRREFFVRQLGGFPPRTPLDSRVVGHLSGQGYRIEKILFASRPQHHVTANLYLPTAKPPYPAVLIPCGHSHDGKAAGAYQRMCILLANSGIAALCYDPIGQGERYQMLDYKDDHTHFATASRYPVPHPRVQYLPTIEHTTMGLGCILLGSNIAQYRIWDGMRAIDYLQSRDDIISDRIGCAGNSGGGTLTAYLMALDDRIVAAAPVCFLTTFRRLIDTRGAQDAEQNIFGQIAFGMDEADYVLMRAPRPTLICAATRDATFDIQGTWDLFRQAKRFYSRLGNSQHVDLIEADAPHGFTIRQREAVARWMRRWLLGIDGVVHEVQPLPDPLTDKKMQELSQREWTQADLQCSPNGQVLLMPGEKSVFQLNADLEQQSRRRRVSAWRNQTPAERRDRVRDIIGLRTVSPPEHPSGLGGRQESPQIPTCKLVGTIQREGYVIEKLVLQSESGIQLPALAFIPPKPNGQVCLYLHGESMKTDATSGGPIEVLELMEKQDQIVLAAELRGIGETESGSDKRDYGRGRFGRDVQEFFLAYLIGRSYVGMRAQDVAAWADFLSRFKAESDRENEIHLVAIGEAAIPALHAAALEPERFATVQLRYMISSWSEIVRTPESLNQAVNVVHGALKHYDLSDLIDLIGTEKVQITKTVNVLDHLSSSK